MRITGHETFVYRLPYRRTVRWFNSSEDEAVFVALLLHGEDGARGVAEAPVKPTWSGLSPRALIGLVEDLYLPALGEVDVGDAAAVAKALSVFPGNHVAKMLVDNGCAAMAAHRAGVPLWRRFGGTADVTLSWCVTRQAPEAMAAEAADMVAAHGFGTIKIKGGQGLETDRAAIRAIRAAAGSDITYTVDANGAYAPDETLNYLTMLADESIVLAEDPTPLQPDASFTALAAASPLPILVDSPCVTRDQARQFLSAGARAISVKPGRIGFTEAGLIRDDAEAGGAALCSGLYAESALGSLLSLQFSAALDSPVAPAEQSFYLLMAEQVIEGMPPIRNGRIRLPDNADLASLVDWGRLKTKAET